MLTNKIFNASALIPAIVHGLYDSFADLGNISLVMVFLGLMLLIMYLKQSVDYQSKLRQ